MTTPTPREAEREAFEVAMLKDHWRNFTGEMKEGFWYYDNSDLNARWIGWRRCVAARAALAAPPGSLAAEQTLDTQRLARLIDMCDRLFHRVGYQDQLSKGADILNEMRAIVYENGKETPMNARAAIAKEPK